MSVGLAVMVLAGGPIARAVPLGSGSVDHSFAFTEEQIAVTSSCEHDIVTCQGAERDRDLTRAGQPALPVLTCHFLLPPGTTAADLKVTVRGSLELTGFFSLPPIQADTGEITPPDPAIYGSAEPYPADPVRLQAAGGLKGYDLVTVRVWPLRYIPAQGRLELLTGIDISIATRPLTAFERQGRFVPLREEWEPRGCRPEVQWLEQHLLNPLELAAYDDRSGGIRAGARGVWESRPFGGFTPTELPSLEGPPVSMVIITDDQRVDGGPIPGMVATFQGWADWKTSIGVPAIVRTVRWIDENYEGVDRPEKIRAFLEAAASLWGTDYVLLGGDLGIVPARMLGGPASTVYDGPRAGDDAADKYYAELDLNWNLNGNAYFGESGFGHYDVGDDIAGTGLGEYVDLWIGRLPVRDAGEATRVLAKIAAYVSRPGAGLPADPSFYSHVLLASGTEGDWCSLNAVADVEAIRTGILSQSPVHGTMTISRMYPDLDVSAHCPRLGQAVRCLQAHYEAMGGAPPDRPFLADEFERALDLGINGKPVGYVFHYEHSNKEVLGMQHGNEAEILKDFTDPGLPSDLPGCGACRSSTDTTQTDEGWLDACTELLRDALPSGWQDDFTKERADHLENGPDYFIATSAGCQVNRYERDAVGEHLVRNPHGGAVAFLGSSPNSGLEAGRNFLACAFVDGIEPVGAAGGLAVCGWDLRFALGYSLLGDPQMPLRTEAPRELSAVVAPARFPRVGPQAFTVTVRDRGTQLPVAGARVCLQQTDHAYAVAWTGSDGVAAFSTFSPMTMSDNIVVMATARNSRPAEATCKPACSAPTPAHVAYVNHSFEDHVAGGDGDGIFEAGETGRVQIIARNMGTSAAPQVTGHLWVSAPVLFDLSITGHPGDPAYEPENIYIGEWGAHPHPQDPGRPPNPGSGAGETFRLPGNHAGLRAEGEPLFADPTRSRILVWRDQAAVWHVRTHCAPGDGDAFFEGFLRTRGGFSDVTLPGVETTGLSPDICEYNPGSDPDLIHFLFRGAGDPTPDELCFRAEAHLWIDVDPDFCELGTLAGGDEVIAVFGSTTTPEIPDREELVFTLATEDAAQRWSFSDFGLPVGAPQPRYLAQAVEIGEEAGSGWVRIRPALANAGSTGLDGAEVIMHPIWPIEYDYSVKVAEIGPVGPGETAVVGEPLYLQRAGSDWIEDLRYDLELRVDLPSGGALTVWRRDVEVLAPPAPGAIALDEAGGAVTLRWEPVASPDVTGYHVYQNLPGEARRLTLAPITGTTRYEVTGLAALDACNQYIDYRYSVTSIDASGNESTPTPTATARLWLPEMPGWPKYLAGGSDCAPKVFDLDGDGDLEIVAAGADIYAWHHDGRPVVAGNADGLLFAPPVGQYPSSGKFVMALAVDQLDSNLNPEIVGNFSPVGVFALEYNRLAPPGANPITTKWFRSVRSLQSPPVLEDLDQADRKLEVILTGNGSDSNLYIWTAEGVTFRDPFHGTSGKFTRIHGSHAWCYQSLSVGNLTNTYPGLEIVQALPNGIVVGYRTDQWSPQTPLTCLISNQSKYRVLSTPLLGDVDGDGLAEIVTTRVRDEGAGVPGGIWVIGLDGNTEDWIAPQTNPFRFTTEPPAPAALVDLDGNGDLDVVVGGGRHGDAGTGAPGEEPWAATVRLHLMLAGAPARDTLTVEDRMMIPGRRDFSIAARSQPVVGDIDGDGRLEILVPTDGDYLTCFEWDNATHTARAEPGWPQLFDDMPLTPILADVDRTTSHLEMVVQDRSGAVHLIKLPGLAAGAALPWSQYGYNTRNTFRAGSIMGGDGGEDPSGESGGSLAWVGPGDFATGPTSPSTIQASFSLKRGGAVRLEVFDVQGRCVRVLFAGDLAAGAHAVGWDGRSGDGSRVPSGIYLLRLSAPDGERVRRVALTR